MLILRQPKFLLSAFCNFTLVWRGNSTSKVSTRVRIFFFENYLRTVDPIMFYNISQWMMLDIHSLNAFLFKKITQYGIYSSLNKLKSFQKIKFIPNSYVAGKKCQNVHRHQWTYRRHHRTFPHLEKTIFRFPLFAWIMAKFK